MLGGVGPLEPRALIKLINAAWLRLSERLVIPENVLEGRSVRQLTPAEDKGYITSGGWLGLLIAWDRLVTGK